MGKYPIVSQENSLINGYWNNQDDLLKVNKPVVVFGEHTKCIKYVDFSFVKGADGVKIFLPKENINSKFFYYCLKSLNLKSLGYARHYRLLKEKFIPLPPLSKQKEIVAVLDTAFEGIDKMRANIEKKLANANEIFQSKLNAIFTQKGKGWKEKKLGEVSIIQYGYTNKINASGNCKYLRITDIQNQEVNWDTVPFVVISDTDYNKYKLEKGDIVFSRTGATTGKNYLILNSPRSVFASYLIRVKINITDLLPTFLHLFFQSKIYWGIISLGISGSTQGGFNAKKLSNIIISFPPLPEQKEIVVLLDKLSDQTKVLEVNYKKQLSSLDELKKISLRAGVCG